MKVRELREKLLEIPNQEMNAIKGLLQIDDLGINIVSVFGDADYEQGIIEDLGATIYHCSTIFHKEHYLPEHMFVDDGIKGYCLLLPIGEIKDGED